MIPPDVPAAVIASALGVPTADPVLIRVLVLSTGACPPAAEAVEPPAAAAVAPPVGVVSIPTVFAPGPSTSTTLGVVVSLPEVAVAVGATTVGAVVSLLVVAAGALGFDTTATPADPPLTGTVSAAAAVPLFWPEVETPMEVMPADLVAEVETPIAAPADLVAEVETPTEPLAVFEPDVEILIFAPLPVAAGAGVVLVVVVTVINGLDAEAPALLPLPVENLGKKKLRWRADSTGVMARSMEAKTRQHEAATTFLVMLLDFQLLNNEE